MTKEKCKEMTIKALDVADRLFEALKKCDKLMEGIERVLNRVAKGEVK